MSEHDKAGFEIGGKFYPMPEAFRLGDPVLIEDLTGMDFQEFLAALGAMDEDNPNAVVMVGMVGVAVWQKNPLWKREKVVKFVQSIDLDSFEAVAPDAEEDEPIPPAVTPEPKVESGTEN